MAYFIYHDKVTHAAKLHREQCGACKRGGGMHGHQVLQENEWYGPFASKQDAMADAQARGIGGILRDCGLCRP